ncbi:30S ribosomal protein S16 [Aquipuribacter sp. MA13-6]|uniref:30S ribosomal protein S16 n=1 Tax=Aquipuribacter sp. MA13-6 TaxID=3440839 RepID=UPI003EEDA075
MAVKIRLKRLGKIRAPYYRVVVADSRTRRDGRAIEEIGKYHPTEEPSLIEIDSERALYWLGVGAQPTEQVAALLKITGDWQKHKGLPGTEGTLRVKDPKPDKKLAYEAAMRDAKSDLAADATTPRKKAAKAEAPAAEPKAEEPKADEAPKAEEPKADEAPKAEEPKADEAPKAEEPKADEAPKAEEPKADEAPKAEES